MVRLLPFLPIPALVTFSCTADRAVVYDLVIAGATLIDGTGAARFHADVAIAGDRIARISRTGIGDSALRRIDGTDLVLAPGFIDVHAHLEPLLALPDAESHVRQGVTTAIGGPDGSAPLPLAPYLDSAEALGVGLNVAFLVGHNSVRREVMGMDNRPPTDTELEEMRSLVQQAMD